MYFFKEGFQGIRRHPVAFFGSCVIIAVCLALTTSCLLLWVNLDRTLDAIINENEFVAYVDPALDEKAQQALGEQISNTENVSRMEYISSQEAMERYQERMGGDKDAYRGLPDDLLQPRFTVGVKEIGRMEETSQAVEKLQGITHVSVAVSVARGFSAMQKTVARVGLFLLGVLLVVSLLIISNSIRLAMQGREQEIAIMKMVGATNLFIQGPFMIEGTLLGLLGGGLAFLLEWGFYDVIQRIIDSYKITELLYVLPFSGICLWILLGCVLTGLCIGVFSSLIAIRKYLRV